MIIWLLSVLNNAIIYRLKKKEYQQNYQWGPLLTVLLFILWYGWAQQVALAAWHSFEARCNIIFSCWLSYIRTASANSPQKIKNKHIVLKMFDINLLKHNNIEKHFIRDSKEIACNKMFTKVRIHTLHMDLYGKVQNNYKKQSSYKAVDSNQY
jgi:hypothetical protein